MQADQKAPVFQTGNIFIQANPEAVWAVLTDINNWPDWNPKISRASHEGQIVAGAQFKWKINGASIASTLHTVEPNRTFGWTGVTFGGSAIHNWYLSRENGGTLVQVEESMEGWLVWIFKGKMNKDLAADIGFWLRKLKEVSEGIVQK